MEKKDLRIVFMGTPEFAVETLKALVENGYNVQCSGGGDTARQTRRSSSE